MWVASAALGWRIRGPPGAQKSLFCKSNQCVFAMLPVLACVVQCNMEVEFVHGATLSPSSINPETHTPIQ
jgi:hypothetical protein